MSTWLRLPLGLVRDPLVPDPLLPEQNRTSCVLRFEIHVGIGPRVEPGDRGTFFRYCSNADEGKGCGAASLGCFKNCHDGRNPIDLRLRVVKFPLVVVVEVGVSAVVAADAVVATLKCLGKLKIRAIGFQIIAQKSQTNDLNYLFPIK